MGGGEHFIEERIPNRRDYFYLGSRSPPGAVIVTDHSRRLPLIVKES